MLLNVGTSVKGVGNSEYILDEIIGQGGFGYVFKAHRTNDNSVFAIKTMLPSFRDSSAEEAFKNEMQAAAGIKGKNVIKYEFIHNGDVFPELPPYIIMEYADGGTLGSILEEKQRVGEAFELPALLDIFKQLSNGMSEINQTLVHRDIKPDNILLCGDTLKISDFGLSKIATENTRTHTFKGGGTLLYMAPEAWDLSKNTIQMDIYSMGIIFYQLATLSYPYSPIPITYDECKNAHLYAAITSLEKCNTCLTPSLISVINRMLEKSVKKRFTDWNEVVTSIEKQMEPNTDSTYKKMVAMAVSAKNADDIARQRRDNQMRQQEKEKSDFITLIWSQVDNTIISPIMDFANDVNEQYAGDPIFSFRDSHFTTHKGSSLSWNMNISPNNSINISMEAILKDSLQREVSANWSLDMSQTRTEHFIPQYNKKNILAWGQISNRAKYGFNLLLLDSGGIYGDWVIMNNRNNLSIMTPGKERREPFAFSLQELPREIHNVQITSFYTADFKPFDNTSFINLIKTLAFDLC